MQKSDGSFTNSIPNTVEYVLSELIPQSVEDAQPTPVQAWTAGQPISSNDLKRIVWKQKFKAPGEDGITARILRSIWNQICIPVTEIMNEALLKCIFPNPWKNAKVRIILKGRDKDPVKVKSYRPVSLLPVLGKILEEVICVRLEDEIGMNLSVRQHGYRAGKSTSSAIKSVIEWTNNRSEKHVLGTFLDISGAFDNVSWATLEEDMTRIGCSGTNRKIILDYLSGRTATFQVDGHKSKVALTRGAPQGSKLGPQIWNITMDKLLKTDTGDKTDLVAYADDLAVLVAGETRKEVIKETEKFLRVPVDWAKERGLKFSKEKSVMVPLKGGLVPGFTASFGEDRIKAVNEVKYLGIIISEGLSFVKQVIRVSRTSQEMFSRLKSVKRSKWGLSSAHALLLYKAVYMPRVSYGAELWYEKVMTKKNTEKILESAQRRALLAISGAYKTTSTKALQVITGLPPLHLVIECKMKTAKGMSKDQAWNEL